MNDSTHTIMKYGDFSNSKFKIRNSKFLPIRLFRIHDLGFDVGLLKPFRI